MNNQVAVAVTEPSQVGEARRTAARLAQDAALPEVRRAEVAIVATELAGNLAKYGERGRLFLQTLRSPRGWEVELLAVDRGPGMADVQRCLRDGFSSAGTPGTGLGAVRRLSSEFDIHSTPGAGTVVLSRIGADPAPAAGASSFHWAAVSTPALHELVCGDIWRILERDGSLAVMVADGLGHGPQAAAAASRAADEFDAGGFDGPGPFFESAHRALVGSRGAALAAALVTPGGGIRYAGIGNIAGSIVQADESRGLMSHNGTVGLQMRKAQPLDYPWPDGALLIMHSDGISHRWTVNGHDGLQSRHPAVIAAVLHRDHTRGRDDSTVVVIRRSSAAAAGGSR